MHKSLHILADLYDCRGDEKYLTKVSRVKHKVLQMVKRAGFKIVASRFHKFPPGSNVTDGGITGVIVVSESHLAIHTWPEKGFVNFDVFFCSYSRDNSEKTRKIFKEFSSLYKPQKVRRKEVWRD
ncbi:MAG: adenosylmethionine decarboxylase [Candidatus Sungbacteria bacterium]|uniref:Adenosylmethionine decarboxylase n=1 Tax=Candidatus Sungiibacteriota bacterium TaxID=2750080 RepID=A0A931WNH0_9BACT|nr:adenosylmethionine decarboxylase [Candidatus Sungbacteria bacterium]